MNCIHENKVNKISEYSLLHDIINPSKRIKNINSHYSHILPGYMNTQKVIAEFKNFRISLDSGFSSTIVMIRLMEKLTKKDSVMQ